MHQHLVCACCGCQSTYMWVCGHVDLQQWMCKLWQVVLQDQGCKHVPLACVRMPRLQEDLMTSGSFADCDVHWFSTSGLSAQQQVAAALLHTKGTYSEQVGSRTKVCTAGCCQSGLQTPLAVGSAGVSMRCTMSISVPEFLVGPCTRAPPHASSRYLHRYHHHCAEPELAWLQAGAWESLHPRTYMMFTTPLISKTATALSLPAHSTDLSPRLSSATALVVAFNVLRAVS
jgi:hypothetical protein